MRRRRCSSLVVDDCLEQAECFARLLDAMGHKATFVIHPLDALDAADSLHPDIVFIDLDMPQIGGWTLARMFRQRFPDMRLVAVTGHDPQQYPGFDACLVKPVALDALQRAIAAETEAI